ncbi:MAG TPA: AraC family transcriptional regulator [Flavobacteriales bacterium]
MQINLPAARPLFDISRLQHFDRELPIRGFSVKYVRSGTEHYVVDGNSFPVRAGHYLLVNRTNRCHATIDSPTPVEGLCIDLGNDLIQSAMQARVLPEAFHQEAGHEHFTGPDFVENMYAEGRTHAGAVLKQLACELFREPATRDRTDPGFHTLAEAIVHDHVSILPQLQRVRAVRSGTRKDLFRRVQRAKAFMDAFFDRSFDMAAVAREAAMSEYHFFRAFRMVEGTSPHRYLLSKRIGRAHELLQLERVSVTEAAFRTGFGDAAAFSKAFKKATGMAPSALLERSRRK